MKTFLELYDELNEKPKGLYYNINKKRKEGRKMRKKGEKGAPKASDFERAAQTAKESVQEDDHTAVAKVKSDIKDRKEKNKRDDDQRLDRARTQDTARKNLETEEVKLDETIVDFDYSRNPKGIYNAFMQMSRRLGLTLFNAPTGMTDLKNKGTGRIGATKSNMVKFMKYLNSKGIEPKVEIVNEEVKIDEAPKGTPKPKVEKTRGGFQVMVYSPSSKKYIPQGQPHKNQKDAEKDAKTFEEYSHIKEMIQSGKFTRPEIKKMIERNILEQRSATGYTLFHRSFSDAMQHAYAFARTKMGMVVDPKEIDNKVATGPKKPGTGKTNSYSLKTNKGMLQIQVYNTGSGAKPFELNMYSS